MPAPDFSQATWRKSTRSNGGGAACVMVGQLATVTGVADSKLGDASPILPIGKAAWSAFVNGIKDGSFDA